MRTKFAGHMVLDERDDELLSTGEAARLIGTSRQHVVDLCRRGDLAYTTVGKHRRIRRSDLEQVRLGNRRATRDQTRSLLLAHAVAGQLVNDPQGTLAIARRNIERMKANPSRGATRIWIDEWDRLLLGSITDLLAALTSQSPRSRELRQNSPFAGVLTDEERLRVLATATQGRRAQ